MKVQILESARTIARLHGLDNVTRIAVAKKSGCAEGTVSYHYKSMSKLMDAVVTDAIKHNDVGVVGQALSRKHRLTRNLPEALRAAVVKSIVA